MVEFGGYQDVEYYVCETGNDRKRLFDMLSEAISDVSVKEP
jgi:hypothetical protein